MSGPGWGSMPWGAGPWGAASGVELRLLDAYAIAENKVRLTFNVAPFIVGTLAPHDAAAVARYQFTPSAEPVGLDGEPARAVLPILIERARVAQSFGSVLDVTTDRPLSPWPTIYRISVNGLRSSTGMPLAIGHTSKEFRGLYRALKPQDPTTPTPSRDIANPQTYLGQLDPIPQAGDPLFLGVFPIDASGDYAFDQGVQQLKKRVLRRLVTNPGAFPALPGYGVGILRYGKRLSTEGIRLQVAQDAQDQIAQEPDVAAVTVTTRTDLANPSVTIFAIRVKMASTAGTVQFDVPVSAT